MKSLFILSLITLSFSAWSLECEKLGSPGYCNYTHGTLSGVDAVQFARDPSVNSNIAFSNLPLLEGLSNPDAVFDYGVGSKEFVAEAMNLSSNMTMTAAKTDPRSVGFLKHSVVKSIEALSSENPGQLGNLDQKQLGDSSLRFIAGQSIGPNIGQYQTTDNEQAFISTYDNIALGEAEQALYVGDRANAINFFSNKEDQYRESADKQAVASDFQKEGILRNKQTAEDFRDFFAFKTSVSQNNLSLMPTTDSLLSNCKKNTPANEDNMGVYNQIITPEEREFYYISPPTYNFDFCESYVHNEQDSLLKNLPVHEKLGSIIADSAKMSQGLNEIAQTLSNTNLSAFELQKYLSENETWNALGERQRAWQECSEKNCLAELKEKVSLATSYADFERSLTPEQKRNSALINAIIASKSIPSELKNSGNSFSSALNLASLQGSAHSQTDMNINSPSQATGESSSLKALNARLVAGRKPASQANLKLKNGLTQYQMNKGTSAYYRNEEGTLLGPSGKPVLGFEAAAHLDLFQIISNRYQKKFFQQE